MNKYRNKKTTLDGIEFDSMKEAAHYRQLALLEKAGLISDLKVQVKFELLPPGRGERRVDYIADFTYTENGVLKVVDVKGYRTKEYILKRKMFKYRYPQYEFLEV